jgi:subtilisin family serine protease
MYRKTSSILSLAVATLLFSPSTVVANDIVKIKKDSVSLSHTAPKFADNEIIITFKDGKKSSKMFTRLLQQFLGEKEYKEHEYKAIGAMHIKSNKFGTKALLNILKNSVFSNYIENVSPNNIMVLNATNDSDYNQLWAISNRGQEVNSKKGTADADMDVAEAWEKTTGDSNVVVAVLDTGVDYQHSDLYENMWNGNKNHGYDFAGDDNGVNDDDPMPDTPYGDKGHYHGTHVAGTIGAVSNNESGITGVAQKVSIMAIKVFRPNGYGYSNDILEGLDFVAQKVDEGVNIVAINASYGGGGSQGDATNEAIKKLAEKGVVFCAAAGNDGSDNDAEPVYPASYDAPNIISIAATDQNDALAEFSNYGKNSVDVAAPGTNILSTYPEDKYAYLQGTSMATPNVAGSVALLAAYYPDSTMEERRAMIVDNVDIKDALNGKMVFGGRVNINNALKEKDVEPEPNNAPVAKDDNASTSYETPVIIDILVNDNDKDGDKLTIDSFSTPTNGTVEKKDGKLIYTPNDNFSGEDSFDYVITDGEEKSEAKVTITVKEEEKKNSIPVANDDTATTAYETAVILNVLENDSDNDGDDLTIESYTIPNNGKVEKLDGELTYTPNNAFTGEDSFTYTVTDGTDSATAKVLINVEEEEKEEPINNVPVAEDDKAVTEYEQEVEIDVLKNDSDKDEDALTIKSYIQPSDGEVEQKDGKLTYLPNKGFSGEDSFSYTITDGVDDATARVYIQIKEEEKEKEKEEEESSNTPPKAKKDRVKTKYETEVLINVLENDKDKDGDALTIVSYTTPAHGTVENIEGKLLYTPKDEFSGKDSFEYTISDGKDEASAKVKVKVKVKKEKRGYAFFERDFREDLEDEMFEKESFWNNAFKGK